MYRIPVLIALSIGSDTGARGCVVRRQRYSAAIKSKEEDGILKEVDFVAPSKLLLTNEMDGKIYFAELYCFNTAFANRLHERLKPILGRSIREVGELDL
jgi:hypothetical protein